MAVLEFTDKDGNLIKATGNPRSGGEGDVYDVEGKPDLVVKVYNEKKRAKIPYQKPEDKIKAELAYKELITKIQAMCDICDDTIMERAGWPQQIVYSNKKPVGFIMNKIKYCSTFHQLADTIDRKEKFADNNWKYCLYVAYNLACAVNALHKKGVVIGDINESNFLIGNRTVAEEKGIYNFNTNGIVYSIDCDSFQIPTNNKIFMCSVAKPEYLPPELTIYKKLNNIVRTQNHDNFGLAVLIFQLLMLGRHPYMGIGTPGDIKESISQGYYVFGTLAKQNGILPPYPSEMYSTIYYSLNEEVRLLFEQAFNTTNSTRPTAEEWINVLMGQIKEMLQCSNDESHFYDKDSECIWCKIEKEIGVKPWGYKNNSNSTIASAFNLPNMNYQNIQATQQKPVAQKVQQTTNKVQPVKSSTPDTNTQPICTGFANYSKNGSICAGGILYLYPDYLMFKGHKWNYQNYTEIIPLNEITEVKERGFLISYSIEIVKDGTHTFYVNPTEQWVINLYELIEANEVPFTTTIDYNGINAKAILWFHNLDWVVEFQNWVAELSEGKRSIWYTPPFIKKFIYRLILRPFFILIFSTSFIYSFNDNPSDSFMGGLCFVILALIILFAFIPEKVLKQPIRRIAFICILVTLISIYAPLSKQSNNAANNNNNSNQEETVSKLEIPKPPTINNTVQPVEEKQANEPTSNFDINEIKNNYVNEVIRNINNNKGFDFPGNSLAKSGKIKFKILKDGSLDSYEIIESSGYIDIDKAAVQLLKSSAPFKPFPEEINNDFLNITYNF